MLLFCSVLLKHGHHFHCWNQSLIMRMRVWQLDCHENGQCCYLVMHIENLLHPLQLFYSQLWPIYWLSIVLWAISTVLKPIIIKQSDNHHTLNNFKFLFCFFCLQVFFNVGTNEGLGKVAIYKPNGSGSHYTYKGNFRLIIYKGTLPLIPTN
jgi:hypothetical protein